MDLSRQAVGGSIDCAAAGVMNSSTFEFGTIPGKDSVGKDNTAGKFSALKPGQPEGGGASPRMLSAPTINNEAKTDSLESQGDDQRKFYS